MDLFVLQNYMDSDIPFPPHLLPLELGDSKGQFLAIQDRCLTTAIDLEKGVDGKHLHLLEAAMTIFTNVGILVLEDMGESPYEFSGVFVD